MQGGDHDGHVDSNFPRRRVAALLGGSNFKLSRFNQKHVLMERSVNIDDLNDLKFENRSLSMVFIERQWTHILETKGKVYSDIVREFYNELRRSSRMEGSWIRVFVREVKVVIGPDTIATFLNLPLRDDDEEYPKSSQWSNHEIYRALTDTKDVYDHDHHMDKKVDLLPFFQMLHLIVAANVTPTKDTTKLSIERGKFLLDIARGVDIDLPNHIFNIIDSSHGDELPFGGLITGLLLEAGVEIRSDEQPDQPMEPICWTKPISQTGLASLHQVKIIRNDLHGLRLC